MIQTSGSAPRSVSGRLPVDPHSSSGEAGSIHPAAPLSFAPFVALLLHRSTFFVNLCFFS